MDQALLLFSSDGCRFSGCEAMLFFIVEFPDNVVEEIKNLSMQSKSLSVGCLGRIRGAHCTKEGTLEVSPLRG